jgi:hypothetical protein
LNLRRFFPEPAKALGLGLLQLVDGAHARMLLRMRGGKLGAAHVPTGSD